MLKVEPDAMFVAENYEPLLRFDFLCKGRVYCFWHS